MSEVEARLSELKSAATQVRRTGLRIEESLQMVRGLIDPMLAQGWLDADFAAKYYAQRQQMDEWALIMQHFGRKLAQAAEDLGVAIDPPPPAQTPAPPTVGAPMLPVFDWPIRTESTPVYFEETRPELAIEPPAPPEYALTDYVSNVNQPVFEQLLQEEAAIKDYQADLLAVMAERTEAVGDLEALENRLMSAGYTPTEIDEIARIQTMRDSITAYDQHISALQVELGTMQANIDDLTERLGRVRPGAGADLALIATLEGGETPEIIRNNTEGCVHHIVNRINIPAGLPRDAHLWDEMIARYAEYGVQSGDVPLAGAVIQLDPEHPYADDALGHLMYIERVEDGVVWVTDNNYNEPVKLTDLTTDLNGPHIRYLYFPWHTQA